MAFGVTAVRQLTRVKPASYRPVLFAWIAFLAAGTFFSLMTPLGEGIDESAHFSYVQYLAQMKSVPLGHSNGVSTEIDSFLRNHPVGKSLSDLYPPLFPHDAFWKQSVGQRESEDRSTAALRFSGNYVQATDAIIPQYESHQPPLYYALAAPAFDAASKTVSFVDTFLITRLWSVLLASLLVPGAFVLARQVFVDVRTPEAVVAVVVLFPGLYPGIARVSNEAAAAPIACWLLVMLLAFLRTNERSYFYGLSVVSVMGLWTKAFFIPLTGSAILALFCCRRRREALALLLISLFGLPWYIYTFLHTASFTGLPETVTAQTTIGSSVSTLSRLDWGNVFKVLVSSHIWIGNSSLLGVRSWMYRTIFWFFVFGVAGLLRRPRRLVSPPMLPLVLTYGGFAAALVYYATQVFQRTGISVAQGWYLTLLVPLEAVMFVAGMGEWMRKNWRWPVAAFGLLLFALFIYSTAFVALPYYAGLTTRTAQGHVGTYHISRGDFWRMPSVLLRFYPNVPVVVPWLLLGVFAMYAVYGLLSVGAVYNRARP
jgi:hypothetical protein